MNRRQLLGVALVLSGAAMLGVLVFLALVALALAVLGLGEPLAAYLAELALPWLKVAAAALAVGTALVMW